MSSNLLFLIKILLKHSAATPMKNTFNHCFITEFCHKARPLLNTWKKLGVNFTVHEIQSNLKYLWFSIPFGHLSGWSTIQSIAGKGDIAHYVKKGFCTFTLKSGIFFFSSLLSWNRICCNLNIEGLLSHLKKNLDVDTEYCFFTTAFLKVKVCHNLTVKYFDGKSNLKTGLGSEFTYIPFVDYSIILFYVHLFCLL